MSFKIEMPTKDIPVDEANLSPALAVMVAQIVTPRQYATFVGVAVAGVNAKCPRTMQYIEK